MKNFTKGKAIQMMRISFLFILAVIYPHFMVAQGTWTPLLNSPTNISGGYMVLLTDGTVLAKSSDGGGDGIGNIWSKLTPNSTGSYINGTWSTITPMNNTRLYFSTQILRDGRVYVVGGEYGTGGSAGEIYDPVANTWTATPFPALTAGNAVLDANSKLLPDGRVLQSVVQVGGGIYSDSMVIYDPALNTYTTGPTSLNSFDESSWTLLPDSSILFVDFSAQTSERYIPSMNQWIADANLPVAIYDSFDGEMGCGVLLPNGKVIFFGSSGHTAIYTPSGNMMPGTYIAGPDIPNGNGTTDAPAAMMVNGKILMAASPAPASSSSYPSPTQFYEYDYVANAFTLVSAPGGGSSLPTPVYTTNFLNLPDGNIIFTEQGTTQYYVYTPSGSPIAAGIPTASSVLYEACNTFGVTGMLFNGISEGSAYGDDFQEASNYPLVRLSNSTHVYYGRTFKWNRIAVMTGTAADTVQFSVPAGFLAGTYSLQIVANGFASSSITFTYNPVTTLTLTSNPSSDSICSGGSVVITAAGAMTYSWSNSITTASVSVSPTVTATYSVTGTNNNLCTAVSTVTVTVKNCTTGISNLDGNEGLIFPNPFTDQFTISGFGVLDKPGNITLLDMLGNNIKIETSKVGQNSIQVFASGLAPGAYILNVNGQFMRLMKQ